MKDTGRKGSIGLAAPENLSKMRDGTCAARSDDRNGYGFTDCCREIAIEAIAGAVAVHGGKKDFTGTALLGLAGPLHDATTDGLSSTVNKDLRVTDRICSFGVTPRIDCYHDRLCAETAADGSDQRRVGERGGVDADFIRTGLENLLCIAR